GLRTPNLPSEEGLVVSYSGVVETAHRVGRTLHDIDDPVLRHTNIAEVIDQRTIGRTQRAHPPANPPRAPQHLPPRRVNGGAGGGGGGACAAGRQAGAPGQ
uniref:hypothetical protein n=1 Tax=Nocardia brasiliensis TaxID=37326 RepID=UPI002458162B